MILLATWWQYAHNHDEQLFLLGHEAAVTLQCAPWERERESVTGVGLWAEPGCVRGESGARGNGGPKKSPEKKQLSWRDCSHIELVGWLWSGSQLCEIKPGSLQSRPWLTSREYRVCFLGAVIVSPRSIRELHSAKRHVSLTNRPWPQPWGVVSEVTKMSVDRVCKQELSQRRVLVRCQIIANCNTPAKKHKATDHVRRFGWKMFASVGSLAMAAQRDTAQNISARCLSRRQGCGCIHK